MIPPPPFLISVVRVSHSVIDNDREKSPCVFHFVHDISSVFLNVLPFCFPLASVALIPQLNMWSV